MLEFFLRPLRSALGVAEHEVATPFEGTEKEIVEAANAMRRAADSIEHHVEVVEGLATSVGPLTESVNRLTSTMSDLVTLLAPMAKAEREVAAVRRAFGFRRQPKPAEAPVEIEAPVETTDAQGTAPTTDAQGTAPTP